MANHTLEFCDSCQKNSNYNLKKVKQRYTLRDKEYDFFVTRALCTHCGEEMNVDGLIDLNSKEIDEQYREEEDIVSVDDIHALMDIYNIGKAPLSLALGFGEITVTRYLIGQMPSIEYSDILKQVLQYPECMEEYLKKNKDKIGNTAYKKSMNAVKELEELLNVSDKILCVVSYIFLKNSEISPLSLHKILYYIQGIYMLKYDKPLFVENCKADIHGPVYKDVYDMFKTFMYNPCDDHRFVLIRDRFKDLESEEREVIDLVLDTFGMYSEVALRKLIHNDVPWLNAIKQYDEYMMSEAIIDKADIKSHFIKVNKDFDILKESGLKEYIHTQIGPL